MLIHMSRPGLRIVPLVTLLLLGANVHGTEFDLADHKQMMAREKWASRDALVILLAVDRAWVDQNSSLFADLLVTNGSMSAIRLPRGTVCQHHWGSRVDLIPLDASREIPLESLVPGSDAEMLLLREYMKRTSYPPELLPRKCDTLELFRHRRETILAEEDIETIAPGRTALLRAVYLGQFVPDPRDRDHAVRSFEVIYSHWPGVLILPGRLAIDETALAEEIERQSSLYDGVLKGRGEVRIR